MAIFTHVTVGTNDLPRARKFYDKVLGALGYKRLTDLGENGSIWGESAPEFFVLKPANGLPANWGNGVTVSFVAPSRAAVAKFHKEALGTRRQGRRRRGSAQLASHGLRGLSARSRRQQDLRVLLRRGVTATLTP